jgi:O-antigen ligase
VLLARTNRRVEWLLLVAAIAILFAGLFFSYSQSSYVALFVVTAALAFLAGDRRFRVVLVVCALAATLAAGAFAATSIEGRSARDVTSGRSRLVSITVDAFRLRPGAGVGIGGQPQASAEANGRRTPKRSASHTTPLTVLAELGIVGFGIYLWMLAAIGWALARVTRVHRLFGLGLAAVFLVVFVHSLLYAGFFEDPLTWGVVGLAAGVLAAAPEPASAKERASETAPAAPKLLAH